MCFLLPHEVCSLLANYGDMQVLNEPSAPTSSTNPPASSSAMSSANAQDSSAASSTTRAFSAEKEQKLDLHVSACSHQHVDLQMYCRLASWEPLMHVPCVIACLYQHADPHGPYLVAWTDQHEGYFSSPSQVTIWSMPPRVATWTHQHVGLACVSSYYQLNSTWSHQHVGPYIHCDRHHGSLYGPYLLAWTHQHEGYFAGPSHVGICSMPLGVAAWTHQHVGFACVGSISHLNSESRPLGVAAWPYQHVDSPCKSPSVLQCDIPTSCTLPRRHTRRLASTCQHVGCTLVSDVSTRKHQDAKSLSSATLLESPTAPSAYGILSHQRSRGHSSSQNAQCRYDEHMPLCQRLMFSLMIAGLLDGGSSWSPFLVFVCPLSPPRFFSFGLALTFSRRLCVCPLREGRELGSSPLPGATARLA